MKLITLLLILIPLALNGREVTSINYWSGERYELTLDTRSFEKETEWNPSKGLIPVSAEAAIKKAKDWMETHFPSENYYFVRVALVNHAPTQEKNNWTWAVSLGNGKQSVLGEDSQGREMIERDSIDLLIKMDGTTLGPTKAQK